MFRLKTVFLHFLSFSLFSAFDTFWYLVILFRMINVILNYGKEFDIWSSFVKWNDFFVTLPSCFHPFSFFGWAGNFLGFVKFYSNSLHHHHSTPLFPLSDTHTHTFSHIHAHTHSHTNNSTPTPTLTLSRTHPYSCAHGLTLIHMMHTHTHTHRRTHTHVYFLLYFSCYCVLLKSAFSPFSEWKKT